MGVNNTFNIFSVISLMEEIRVSSENNWPAAFTDKLNYIIEYSEKTTDLLHSLRTLITEKTNDLLHSLRTLITEKTNDLMHSLTNLITYCCINYTLPSAGLKKNRRLPHVWKCDVKKCLINFKLFIGESHVGRTWEQKPEKLFFFSKYQGTWLNNENNHT